MTDIETLRYPVGPLQRLKEPLDAETRAAHVGIIEQTPRQLRSLVDGQDDADLERSYRPEGWTVRQLLHHIADSHINAYVRMKLAATEDLPLVKTYDEARWAELPEARTGPIAMSMALIEALHERWVAFLRALPESDLRRAFMHPDWGQVTIEESITMYSWHCRHHSAHVAIALGRSSPVQAPAITRQRL
jgi:uncharacterized damage-inducible protein DinB